MKTLKKWMMMSALAAVYCFLAVSCMTVDRRGAFLIDSPKVIKEHNIIEDKRMIRKQRSISVPFQRSIT